MRKRHTHTTYWEKDDTRISDTTYWEKDDTRISESMCKYVIPPILWEKTEPTILRKFWKLKPPL